MSRRFAVIVNECADVGHPNTKAINLRATSNADANFKFQPETMTVGLKRELTGVEMDWLTLVVAMYATDLACQRGHADLDWGRDIELHVPLRDPDALVPHIIALQEIFADLTGDRLRIHLEVDDSPIPIPRYGQQWPDFDAVALFSGGVDSFVGAARLLGEGRRPLLISHGGGANTTPQSNARKALAERFEISPSARVTTSQEEGFPAPSEDSQRARSLLFMGAAAVIAAVEGIEEVYINENGVMAVHVPLTAARIGSLSTKTAYPPIVERIASVASAVLGAPIVIRNNLVAETKPEVVSSAKSLGVSRALPHTASCWTWHRQRRHCGTCVPCLIRRISFVQEGVVDLPYISDPFESARDVRRPFAHDNMAHLCQVVQAIDGLTDIDFELDHPEILDGGQMISPAEARDLYRRWASQAIEVLEKHPVSREYLS